MKNTWYFIIIIYNTYNLAFWNCRYDISYKEFIYFYSYFATFANSRVQSVTQVWRRRMICTKDVDWISTSYLLLLFLLLTRSWTFLRGKSLSEDMNVISEKSQGILKWKWETKNYGIVHEISGKWYIPWTFLYTNQLHCHAVQWVWIKRLSE